MAVIGLGKNLLFKSVLAHCEDLGILGASTIILSRDIDKYAFMCSSNFYESDVT